MNLSAKRLGIAATVAVLLLAFALRLHDLGAQSLWYDEGTSAALATRSLATITRNASDDIHPPLYYWLLATWTRATGLSEVALRSLSVVLGTALVATVALLGRRFWSWPEGVASALVAAMSPLLVWYSQEARMYMLAALLGTLLAWTASELTGPGSFAGWRHGQYSPKEGRGLPRDTVKWLACVALGAGTLYSHYFVGTAAFVAANVIGAAGIALHWRSGSRFPHRLAALWVSAQLAALVLFAPWIAAAWHTIKDWPALGPPLGTLAYAMAALRTLALGLRSNAINQAMILAPAALAAVGLAAGAVRPARRWGTFVAACMALTPLVAMWAQSLVRPAWNPKFLIGAAAGFELLVGSGVVLLAGWIALRVRPRQRASLATAAAAVLLLLVLTPRARLLHAMFTDPAMQRDDYRSVAAEIGRLADGRDAVVLNAPTQIELFEYYDRGAHTAYPLPLERPPDCAETTARLRRIADEHDDVFAVLWATNESDPRGIVEGWLNAERPKVFDRWYGNVRLAMWSRQPPSMDDIIDAPLVFADTETDELILQRLTAPAQGGVGSDRGAHQSEQDVELTARAGDVLPLTAWWSPAGPGSPAADYKVFLHLVDEDGTIVAQRDMAPGGGAEHTSSWEPGPVGPVEPRGFECRPAGAAGVEASALGMHVDRMGLLLHRGISPGTYRLVLGVYDPADGDRLLLRSEGQESAGDGPSTSQPGRDSMSETADAYEVAAVRVVR
jgi:hypothetical protein